MYKSFKLRLMVNKCQASLCGHNQNIRWLTLNQQNTIQITQNKLFFDVTLKNTKKPFIIFKI